MKKARFLLAVSFLALCVIAPVLSQNQNVKGEFLVWTFVESYMKDTIAEFNKLYPDVKVNEEPMGTADVVTKLQTNTASGIDVADIIWLEMSFRGTILSSGLLDNLEGPPYNLDRKVLLDWLIPLASDAEGKVAGLEIGPAPATLAYRRPMAKKYLGTDDPDKIYKSISTWDDLVAKGKEMLRKSGGQAFTFPSMSEAASILTNQYTKPLVVNNVLNVKDVLREPFQILEKMQKAGILNVLEGPSYRKEMSADNNLLWSCPMWAPQWKFKSSAPDQAGNWGILSSPPAGKLVNLGGTLLAIPKAAKNKEAAWAYMKWLRLTEDGTKFLMNKYGDIPSLKSMYKDMGLFTYIPHLGDSLFGLFRLGSWRHRNQCDDTPSNCNTASWRSDNGSTKTLTSFPPSERT